MFKLTLFRYLFHEIWPTFITSLVVFIFVVLAARILNISEWIVNYGVGPFDIVRMLSYLLPGMVLFVLPAALLMAVFIAFLRLSSDNEIMALKCTGMSLFQMLPPVFVVSVIGLGLAIFLSAIGGPWGSKSFKDIVFNIARSKADLGIKERIFFEPFGNVTFYINSFSNKDKIMRDLFLVDSREPSITNTIVAKEGVILSYPTTRTLTVHLLDGTIFVVEKNSYTGRTIKFGSYDLTIGLDDIMSGKSMRKRSPKEMSIGELLNNIRSTPKGQAAYNDMATELMERFSIPLAVFLMGIIGAPLGAQIRSSGRSLGIAISLIIFVAYYLCLSGVRSLGDAGALSPFIGMWIPVVFLFVACLFLLRREKDERPVYILEKLVAVFNR